jgi:cardiolipin synthase
MPINIPILLTWLRIILIPLLIAVYYVPEPWLRRRRARPGGDADLRRRRRSTDWLDGYLARRWQQTSAFGAFLDPVADKLMVAAALIVLVQLGRLDAILADHHRSRDHDLGAARMDGAHRRAPQRRRVDDRQDQDHGADDGHSAAAVLPAAARGRRLRGGTWLIYIAAVLTLWSMGYYMRMAWPHLIEEDRRR